MKKFLIIAGISLLSFLSVASCGAVFLAAGSSVPAPTVTADTIEPAPSPTLAEVAPTPEVKPEPAAPSKRDLMAGAVSNILGYKIYEDDPGLDAMIDATLSICGTVDEARGMGLTPEMVAVGMYDAAGGDEEVLTLALAGMLIYCPAEYDWLMTAADTAA